MVSASKPLSGGGRFPALNFGLMEVGFRLEFDLIEVGLSLDLDLVKIGFRLDFDLVEVGLSLKTPVWWW